MNVPQLIDSLNFTATPREDYILVLPFVKATSSDILITDENREQPEAGIVVALGPGKTGSESGRFTPVVAKVGEIAWYGRYAGMDFTIQGPKGPVRALVMMDSSVILMEAAGSYAIEVHDDDPRKVHKAGLICEHCPKAEPSGLIAAERQRLINERNEDSLTL